MCETLKNETMPKIYIPVLKDNLAHVLAFSYMNMLLKFIFSVSSVNHVKDTDSKFGV